MPLFPFSEMDGFEKSKNKLMKLLIKEFIKYGITIEYTNKAIILQILS
jgi:hypothetical protein